MSYLKTAENFYRDAAEVPDEGLCCVSSPIWKLPELVIPEKMLEMNYGCGTTVHPRDLAQAPTVAYVGVGGGMELLQFAYFSRRAGAVIGIDPVDEMRTACAENLETAAEMNGWFQSDFIDLRKGNALELPIEDSTVDVAAQNCLFNIFEEAELRQALAEVHRILKPQGRLVMSDPIAPHALPQELQDDERLRAMCLSGALTYDRYLELLVEAGFGTVEVRARRPYRLLDPTRYAVEAPVLLESVEVAAIKSPVPADGPCIFTGSTAIYYGAEASFDDGAGHVLPKDQPIAICDKTAKALRELGRDDLWITPSTHQYDGGGCC